PDRLLVVFNPQIAMRRSPLLLQSVVDLRIQASGQPLAIESPDADQHQAEYQGIRGSQAESDRAGADTRRGCAGDLKPTARPKVHSASPTPCRPAVPVPRSCSRFHARSESASAGNG